MSDYGTIDLSGTLVTASGVAACRPRALVVYGRSTQDGTPTPSSPVGIVSVGGNVAQFANPSAATKTGITFTPLDDALKANGTSTSNSFIATAWRTGVLPAGRCTASVRLVSGTCTSFKCRVGRGATSGSYVTEALNDGDEAHVWFTTNGTDSFSVAPSIPVDAVATDAVFVAQIEYGQSASPYVPYGNIGLYVQPTSDPSQQTVMPIPIGTNQLRSLPDGTCDELTVDQYGHAVLTKRVGSVTYDGTENWTTATVSGTQVYRLSNQASQTGWDTTASGQRQRLCNMLTVATNDQALASTVGTYRSLTHLSVNWDGTNNDLAAFKAALAATPLEIVYLLATPRTIDLGTVELANLTSPELTAWVTGSPEFELTALLKTGRSTVMWDGEELSAGWTFVSDRREQLLPTDVATIDAPGRDGALFGGVTRAVRQVTLALYVLGPVGERAPHVRELAARLAVDGPRPLMFSDEAPLWRMAVPNAEGDSEVYYDAEGYTDVEFVCPDPWLYGEERSVTVPSGGSVTFTVGGTAPTWPTITASATGSSQGAWILRLDDSSRGIYAAIASGVTRPVVADCDARTLSVNDATSMLAPSYDWPELTPGTHTLAMTQGTGAATVTWTERWW